MPTYDYRCDACGHTFSRLQRWSDAPVERCPKCGERPRRLVSLPAIVFKGSGWHITDYRPKDASPDGATPSGGSEKKDEAPKKEGSPARADPSTKE